MKIMNGIDLSLADISERYTSDRDYTPGTVMMHESYDGDGTGTIEIKVDRA